MRGRSARRDYGWTEVQAELADGVHPEVVAARLGEHVAYVLEVADERGWPITYSGVTPDQILSASKMADA